jgi:hypothetical protein
MNKIFASFLTLLTFLSCDRNATVKTVYLDNVQNISADSLTGEWTLTNLSNIENHLTLIGKENDSMNLSLLSNFKYNLKSLDNIGSTVTMEGDWSLIQTKDGFRIILLGLNKKEHILKDSSFDVFRSEKGILMLSQLDQNKISTSFLKTN